MKVTLTDKLACWASVTLDGEPFVCASSADEEAGVVVRDGIEHSGKVQICLLDGAPQWALDEYARRMRAEGDIDLFAKPDTERERLLQAALALERAKAAELEKWKQRVLDELGARAHYLCVWCGGEMEYGQPFVRFHGRGKLHPECEGARIDSNLAAWEWTDGVHKRGSVDLKGE